MESPRYVSLSACVELSYSINLVFMAVMGEKMEFLFPPSQGIIRSFCYSGLAFTLIH